MKRLGLNQARALLALEAATAPMGHVVLQKRVPQLAKGDVAERTLDSLVVRGLVDVPFWRTWELRRAAADCAVALEQAREIVAQADGEVAAE